MGYSIEVVRRARERLAQARSERERENREHLRVAYEQQPRLQEIDRQLRMTMAKAAMAAFAGGDAERLMAEAKQQNQSLQRERRQIVEGCFEEGFLDETPICDRCGGTGYVGSTMCDCLAELCRQEQKKELTFLSAGRESFDQFRLDYYSDKPTPAGYVPRVIMEKTYQTCRRYAFGFHEKAGNLLFSGNTGLGKTFLSACIARTVADQGYSVVYESAGHLFSNLERAKFSGDEDARRICEKYTACDLLIIDDLGTELPGQFAATALYGLLNARLMAKKPMIITTNLNVTELGQRYMPQIASRLQGSFQLLPFAGQDIRLLKNK
mgnify:CR=1 FL=1